MSKKVRVVRFTLRAGAAHRRVPKCGAGNTGSGVMNRIGGFVGRQPSSRVTSTLTKKSGHPRRQGRGCFLTK